MRVEDERPWSQGLACNRIFSTAIETSQKDEESAGNKYGCNRRPYDDIVSAAQRTSQSTTARSVIMSAYSEERPTGLIDDLSNRSCQVCHDEGQNDIVEGLLR